MQKLFSEHVTWRNWKMVAAATIVLGGVMLYVEQTILGIWFTGVPLVALAVCLVPCLIPLAMWWRKSNQRSIQEM